MEFNVTLKQDLEADALAADTADIDAHLTEQEFIRDCLDVARGRGADADLLTELYYRGQAHPDEDVIDALTEVMVGLAL